MPPLDGQTNIQHPQYFVSQSERLSALLNVVVAEASVATDPDACIDYLQLTEILVDLLDQSQLFSALSTDQLRRRQQDVKSFIGKIETVEEAVADWDARTKVESTLGGLKKRSRSTDLDEETSRALKRRRDTGTERDMVADAVYHGLSSNVLPPIIETSPTYWWTEPFCD